MLQSAVQPDRSQLALEIKRHAKSLGFDLVGIAPADPSIYQDYFRQWLHAGQNGTMHWLANRFNERTNPSAYLPSARSAICVAINYHVEINSPSPDAIPSPGKIAQYARGDDYHEIIMPRLRQLADRIRQAAPDAQTRCAVDTAPVMEKELAARAGIGWIGKNTCVINPQKGSWFFLGEILTTLDLPLDAPAADHCGTCRRCLDACPTGALTEPYQLDARKCISYLTIEHRGEIDPTLQPLIGDWLYGCDICQDVCPWNNKADPTTEPSFQPRFPTGALNVSEVLKWQPPDYSSTLRRSAIKRVKLPILQRNARIVAQNLSHAATSNP